MQALSLHTLNNTNSLSSQIPIIPSTHHVSKDRESKWHATPPQLCLGGFHSCQTSLPHQCYREMKYHRYIVGGIHPVTHSGARTYVPKLCSPMSGASRAVDQAQHGPQDRSSAVPHCTVLVAHVSPTSAKHTVAAVVYWCAATHAVLLADSGWRALTCSSPFRIFTSSMMAGPMRGCRRHTHQI